MLSILLHLSTFYIYALFVQSMALKFVFFSSARDILVAFENDDDLKVTNYKALKHNKLLRWTVVSAITMFG